MKQWVGFVFAILFLLSGCAAPANRGMEVREAWARPAAEGTNGVIYFMIRSAEEDELIGASSEVAEATEIHESSMSGDVMEMHPMESVVLKPDEEVAFEPGGLHIMLVGLKQELQTGDAFEVTLHFKNYQDVQLQVPVQDTQP